MLTVSDYCRKTFGRKLWKAALDGGFTCPNRDGRVGYDGCLFCSAKGSGDYAGDRRESIRDQLEKEKRRIKRKLEKEGKSLTSPAFIAYFQPFTNTYGPIERLREAYEEALADPEVALLSIATRPDCLGEEVLALLSEIDQKKPVWVELGLQTIHEETAALIRRGYALPVYDEAVKALHAIGISQVITHLIFGLPGESEEMMLSSVRHVAEIGSDGVKLQNLQVLEGTDLAVAYEAGTFDVLTREAYIDLVAKALALLPENTVVHRITGDPPKDLLIAPKWCTDKKKVMNGVWKRVREESSRITLL